MSKYISDHMLSVGFNPSSGQEFFDTIVLYEKYIRDYFFDVSNGFNGVKWNPDKVIELLRGCDTYSIPANLLFNNHYSFLGYRKKIDSLMNIVNLKSVTILNPDDAKIIKTEYPDLEVHLSTRFWDWGKFRSNIDAMDVINNRCIDVVNISGPLSCNDHVLIDEIHKCGMKVKYITNDGCVINKDYNYSMFPGFEHCMCRPNPFSESACNCTCYNVTNENPWIELCKAFLYKESLQYYDQIDILKISGRHRTVDYVIKHLDYWTSDEPSSEIFMSYHQDMPIIDYQMFLEYLNEKSRCDGYCVSCQKCKEFYDTMIVPHKLGGMDEG